MFLSQSAAGLVTDSATRSALSTSFAYAVRLETDHASPEQRSFGKLRSLFLSLSRSLQNPWGLRVSGIRSIEITMRCAKNQTRHFWNSGKGVQLPRKKKKTNSYNNKEQKQNVARIFWDLVNAFFNELFCCLFFLFLHISIRKHIYFLLTKGAQSSVDEE